MDLPAPLDHQLAALLAAPPSAAAVTADDRYHDLRQEVDKLGSVTGATVDWRVVATLGDGLTRELGKDLNVLAYTTFARHRLRDLPGALVGVVALGRLLAAPPPGLTPVKPRARAAALEWLLTRLQLDLRDLTPTPAESTQLRSLHAALRDLREISRSVLEDMSPGFTPTLQAIDAIVPDVPAGDITTSTSAASPDIITPDPPPNTTSAAGAASPDITAPALTTSPAGAASPDITAPASTTSPASAASPDITAPALTTSPASAASPDITAPALTTSPASAASPDITAPSPPEPPPDPLSLALAALHARAAAWLAPIAPAAPCGADPAGLEAFGDAREELAKLSSVSGETVDWARVEARSAAVLRDSAKDLRVGAWFALARFHREGLPGLALGLCVLIGLLEQFADDLHPRRSKPRRELADWTIRQAAAAVAGLAPAKLRPAALAELTALTERLGAALRARLADEAPSMRPLREALRQASEALAALTPADPPRAQTSTPTATADATVPAAPPGAATVPAAPPGAAPVPAAPPASASTAAAPPDAPPNTTAPPSPPRGPAAPQPGPPLPTPDVPPPPAGLADLDRFLTTTGEALQQAARTLREAAPADPRAYRLLRVGLWIHLTASPPLRPDGNTGLPGLADRDRAQLDELAAAARWPGLLNRSENLLVNHRLALDLQRHSAAALAALGPDHAPAALALRVELRALLARLPDLPTLRDRDGQPLADPATRQWLAAEVDPRGAATTALPADPDDPEFWTGLADALRQPDRAPPLAEAQRRIDASPGEHVRCTRRLALAEACAAAGDHPLAAALFAGLADDLERRGLERWDPPLASRCLAGLARSHQRRGEPPAARLAVHRLGRLDAAAAAALLADLPT